jgi:hypothetical protein
MTISLPFGSNISVAMRFMQWCGATFTVYGPLKTTILPVGSRSLLKKKDKDTVERRHPDIKT